MKNMVDDSKNRNSLIFFLLSCVFAFLQWGLPLLGFNSINFGWILIIAAFICGAIALFVWGPSFKISLFFKIVIVAVVGIIYFGSIIYCKNEPQKQITPPVDKDKLVGKLSVVPAPPLPPHTKRVQKSETLAEDRPYFSIYGQGITIKTKPKSLIEIAINNTGKHTAFNIYHKFIIIGHQFQGRPTTTEFSSANEYPPNIPQLASLVLSIPEDMDPIYAVFAIKYQDKEVPLKKAHPRWYCQIWYFKTIIEWIGTSKDTPPPPLVYASIGEKETIIKNLKPWLEEYLK